MLTGESRIEPAPQRVLQAAQIVIYYSHRQAERSRRVAESSAPGYAPGRSEPGHGIVHSTRTGALRPCDRSTATAPSRSGCRCESCPTCALCTGTSCTPGSAPPATAADTELLGQPSRRRPIPLDVDDRTHEAQIRRLVDEVSVAPQQQRLLDGCLHPEVRLLGHAVLVRLPRLDRGLGNRQEQLSLISTVSGVTDSPRCCAVNSAIMASGKVALFPKPHRSRQHGDDAAPEQPVLGFRPHCECHQSDEEQPDAKEL